MKNDFPINTFYIEENKYDEIKDLAQFKVYKNFVYNSKKGLKILPLLDEEDSIFKNNDFLLNGHFPYDDDEILVNNLFCEKNFKNEKISNCINKKVNIDNMTFKISGIITSDSDKLGIVMSSNPNYSNILNSSELVFNSYNNMEKYATTESDGYILLSIDNFYNNKELINELKSLGIYLYWDNYVETYNSNLNFVFNIILIVIIFIAIIAFLFVNNEISFQLYLRKKEIGIFQIFNISKSRIMKNLVMEYYVNFFKIVIYGIILSFVISLTILFLTNFYIIPKIYTLCVISIAFLAYLFLIVFYPIRKFLKKKIISLIYY